MTNAYSQYYLRALIAGCNLRLEDRGDYEDYACYCIDAHQAMPAGASYSGPELSFGGPSWPALATRPR